MSIAKGAGLNGNNDFETLRITPLRRAQEINQRLISFRWGFDNDHLGTLMSFGPTSTQSFADGMVTGSN
jgi:hypothetical protein